ncbi:hypothetical protein GGR53DRAFT_81293 [Hypoxylon sp. FL1150]|nr:hypothetical protein GGR53DRAFT_81293 [Hypoxylon sp. FL1150]
MPQRRALLPQSSLAATRSLPRCIRAATFLSLHLGVALLSACWYLPGMYALHPPSISHQVASPNCWRCLPNSREVGMGNTQGISLVRDKPTENCE